MGIFFVFKAYCFLVLSVACCSDFSQLFTFSHGSTNLGGAGSMILFLFFMEKYRDVILLNESLVVKHFVKAIALYFCCLDTFSVCKSHLIWKLQSGTKFEPHLENLSDYLQISVFACWRWWCIDDNYDALWWWFMMMIYDDDLYVYARVLGVRKLRSSVCWPLSSFLENFTESRAQFE